MRSISRENKKRVAIAIVSLCIGFMAGKIPEHITITKTDSVKYRFFWSLKKNSNIQKNSYVRADKALSIGSISCDPCSIVKRVGCLPGQKLTFNERRFYCDGELICIAMEKKEPFEYSGIIPEDRYFLVGDNPRSYDSRYFGFIKKEQINARLIPIL